MNKLDFLSFLLQNTSSLTGVNYQKDVEVFPDKRQIGNRLFQTNIGDDAPDKIKDLYEAVNKKLDEIPVEQFEKLADEDVENIITRIFLEKLGDPDDVDEYEISGVKYKKLIWRMEEGILTKKYIQFPQTEITDPILKLEKELDEAIQMEDYEKAAKLRDEIKKAKANLKND